MDVTQWGTVLVSLIGALTALYVAWQNRDEKRAKAQKIVEEAESEDVKQRGAEIDNLRAVNDEWSKQYGKLVERMDRLQAELDQEIKRRKNVELAAEEHVTQLEHEIGIEREARFEAEKRAKKQAEHLIEMQTQIDALLTENAELHTTVAKMQGTIEAQNATISSLQKLVEDKDQQIVKLRQDLSAVQMERSVQEVRRRKNAA